MNILVNLKRQLPKLIIVFIAFGLLLSTPARADSTGIAVYDSTAVSQLTAIYSLLSTSMSSNATTTNSMIGGYGAGSISYIIATPTYQLPTAMNYGQGQIPWFINGITTGTWPVPPNPDTYIGFGFTTADSLPIEKSLDQQALANILTTINGTDVSNAMFKAIPKNRTDLYSMTPARYLTATVGAMTASISGGGAGGGVDSLKIPADVSNYNLNSLLLPVVYSSPTQQTSAKNFIQFVSGMVTAPITLLDFSKIVTPDDWKKAMDDAGVQGYLLSLRSYLAQMSVGLTTLLGSYAQRLPLGVMNPNIEKDLTGTSLMQLDQQAASRRLTDAAWFTNMDSIATPIQVQRETLYVLTEMRLEMFKQRLLLEKLTTILATMQLQQAAMAKQNIGDAAQKLQNNDPFKK